MSTENNKRHQQQQQLKLNVDFISFNFYYLLHKGVTKLRRQKSCDKFFIVVHECSFILSCRTFRLLVIAMVQCNLHGFFFV